MRDIYDLSPVEIVDYGLDDSPVSKDARVTSENFGNCKKFQCSTDKVELSVKHRNFSKMFSFFL
jgi:hypothetical protein